LSIKAATLKANIMSTINPDPNNIQEFLQDYSSYSYDAEAWSPYTTTNTAATPRQTPTYDDESITGSYSYDAGYDQGTEYAASTTYSTTTYTTDQQSLFDGAHTEAASSMWHSTVPSRGTGHVAFAQQFAAEPAPTYPPDFQLWCEFRDLNNCNVVFRGDDEAGWIRHHARHLKDQFPSKVICWFCDHVPFVAQDRASRQANFELRMLHIREHISSDYFGAEATRPDFHVLKHMYKHGLVDKVRYESAMKYSELPPQLRLRDSVPVSSPSRGQPHVHTQVYDLAKEQRQMRRQGRMK
jgi:hypothetical protein